MILNKGGMRSSVGHDHGVDRDENEFFFCLLAVWLRFVVVPFCYCLFLLFLMTGCFISGRAKRRS
jgi:hypothetical protein